MRALLTLVLTAFVALALQVAVMPVILPLPVLPDPVLVLVVYLGLRHHGAMGAAGAFGLGYALDTFSGTVLGLNAFAMTVVYASVYPLARTLWAERGLPAMAIVFVAGCVRWVAALLIALLVEAGPPVWVKLTHDAVPEAVLAALIAPFVFGAIDWERRQVGLG